MTRSRRGSPATRKTMNAEVQASPAGEHSRASAQYIKVVEWSEEDQSYVGYCPGVIGPCCHGDDEVEVFRSLCGIVDEWLAIYRKDNRPLPPPAVGRNVGACLHDAHDSVRQAKQRTI